LEKSGYCRICCVVNFDFKLMNAFSCSAVHSNFVSFLNKACKGAAILLNLGMNQLFSCLSVSGLRKFSIASTLLGSGLHPSSVITCPK
jgi:hypothetical protein